MDKDEDKFREELRSLLNRHCMENASNTPDYVLADYLIGCLKAYDDALRDRDRFFGVDVWRKTFKGVG